MTECCDLPLKMVSARFALHGHLEKPKAMILCGLLWSPSDYFEPQQWTEHDIPDRLPSPLPTPLSKPQPTLLPILFANRILRIQKKLLPNPWQKQANARKKVCCCSCRIAAGCAERRCCDGFVVKFERLLPEECGHGCYQQAAHKSHACYPYVTK